MTELLSKDHRILEKGFMDYRPFGVTPEGKPIRDASGIIIRANVECLEECIGRSKGPEAGAQAGEELCRLLNERIPDPSYHVTPSFLKNIWHSYSYEFVCFLREFCIDLSRDSMFQEHVGREKMIPAAIQVLARPLPLSLLYKMFPHFGHKLAKDSLIFGVGKVTFRSAVLRMKFTEPVYEQFGPYRKRCAEITCQSTKAGLAAVPVHMHHSKPATIIEHSCIADGDEWCEWEVRWEGRDSRRRVWPVAGLLMSAAGFAYLRLRHPSVNTVEALLLTLLPSLAVWWTLEQAINRQQQLIQEQVSAVDARDEELRKAYLVQEQTMVELKRKVGHLTTLHEAGLVLTTTRDREALLAQAFETLLHKLLYDHVLFSFFDPQRQICHGHRLFGFSPDLAAFARQLEVPITDPTSIEGTVVLQGKPFLVEDTSDILQRLHPLNRELVIRAESGSFVSVPLKTKDRTIGSLTANRSQKRALTEDDLSLMVTFGNQVAIALDNAAAYREIEELNIGLEAKVHERTIELQRLNRELQTANDQLQELDRLKSEFFANISHELRTPLSLSLGAFKLLSNLLPTAEAQGLIRTGLRNTARVLFLITEFLDLAKFDRGLMELRKQCLDFAALVRAVAANFESAVRRRIHLRGMDAPVPVEADARQMKKVLYNLLSNAFKFSDPDRGEVWIRLGVKEGWAELEVEDNGIGIPRDQTGRIFDRFTQVEGGASRRYEGTGIGLALVKEIVTAHGGTTTVESELGRGSIFTIRLPRATAHPDAIVAIEDDESVATCVIAEATQEPTSPVVSSCAGGDRPLVLVADDHADMRAYLERLLNRQYRIVPARDGVEGLDRAKTFHPDLIIADVMMPRMSGYDLVKAVRGDHDLRSIPVMILTARAGTEAHVESLEAGADDYIAKPFDEQEFLARVNNLIRSRTQERELIALREEKLTRFLPSPLAEMILADRADQVLRSHRADVTVVFIDLRGFTAFAERTEPEEVMEVLRQYQSEMGRVISDHHGMIERFSGDAMMIFFNDPVPVPNHVEQAVRMAIAMRHRIEQLKQGWSKRDIGLGAGIGVATGYATLGLIGFERRMDYAAIGTVTNLAARLCVQAQDGQILTSGRVWHLINDLVCTEPVGNLTLKGFQNPVFTYNVIGLRTEQAGAR